MKRLILSFFAVLFIGSGIFLIVTFFNIKTIGQGALRVSSNVKADVFLDEVKLGTTPVCKCKEGEMIKEGEYLLNLVPHDKSLVSFSVKIKLTKGILTAVDRTFLPGKLASAYILTLEKINTPEAQLFISSIPEGAIINLNGNSQGITPYLVTSLESDDDNKHEIELQKKGFNKKTIQVKAIPNYKIIANVILGTELKVIENASPSAQLTPSISQTASASATITIQNTPTGFLRVRSEPRISGSEVGRVEPGEEFIILDEEAGWYKIELADKIQGWVSSQYVQKNL